MKTIKCVLILMIAVGITFGCFGADEQAVSEKTDIEAVVKGNNRFALELYEQLREQEGNLFFSPYSISTALAMTYSGAKGRTETQMAKALCFPTEPSDIEPKPALSPRQFHCAFGAIIKDLNARGEKGAYELVVANALWGHEGYGIVSSFIRIVSDYYGGECRQVDFVKDTEFARKTINGWVEKQTKDKIKELIARGVLNSMTRLVLTNAIYFKGNWARQFEKDETKDAPFTLANGRKINTAMMNQTAEFNYMETESFQGLELPYVDNELSMIIFLPKEIDGLAEFEKTFTVEPLSDRLAALRKCKVIVSIPKFTMTSQFGLSDVLKSMGMVDAFVPNVADFSGMNGKRDLFISAVIHKAYVDVNEEGTEAAAATAVVIGVTSVGPSQVPVFRADHPFLFLIRDNNSGSILFIGRVMNPKA